MKGLSGLFALLLLLGTLAACGGGDDGNGDPDPSLMEPPIEEPMNGNGMGDPEMPDDGYDYDMDADMDSVGHHGDPNGDHHDDTENGDHNGNEGEGGPQPE